MRKIRLMLFMAMMAVMSIMAMGENEITFNVDMTVLWGGYLPKEVYYFPIDISGNEFKKMDGTPLNNVFREDFIGTDQDQDIINAVKLTDEDGDGVYTGKIKYVGSGYKKCTKGRLFISKTDPLNNMHTPLYEMRSLKSDGALNLVETVTDSWRPFSSSDSAVNWQWEYKGIRVIETGNYTVEKGLSTEIVLSAGYHRADMGLRRDVTNYAKYTSSDENIARIEKKYTTFNGVSVVNAVRVIGVNKGTATISVLVGGMQGTQPFSTKFNVTVSEYNSITPFQTVMLNYYNYANNPITTNDVLRVDDKFVLKGDIKAATFSPNTRDSVKANAYAFASNSYTIWTKSFIGGEGYKWWINTLSATGVFIPLERWSPPQAENPEDMEFVVCKGKVSGGEQKSVLKIPSYVGSMTKILNGANPYFSWFEDPAKYENKGYGKRDIIVRISKIGTSNEDIIYDPYNGKNPIYDATDITNVTISELQAFDKGTRKYLDYVFEGAATKVATDGRGIKNDMLSTGARTMTMLNFPVGKYRIQLYTLRACLEPSATNYINDYSVLTFENEESFEITSEDYEAATEVNEDSYIINKINPRNFTQIDTYITTKTQNYIEPNKDNIYYKGLKAAVGEKWEDAVSKTFDGGTTQSSITVTEDNTYQGIKPQLDVVVCLDRSSSMSDEMEAVKTAWSSFQSNMSKRGYDIQYRMLSFGGTAKWEDSGSITSGNWGVKSLDESKFATTNNENSGGEPSTVAINSAVDLLNSGRTIGEKKSKRYIIFFTDNGGWDKNPDVDELDKKIRAAGVHVIGLGQVAKNDVDGRMFSDDAGDPDVKYGGGFTFYHLKILLGTGFSWYQISNDSTKILNKLEHGMKSIGYTTGWKITHKTPYPLEDDTRRSVQFDIKNTQNDKNKPYMTYSGLDVDRIYRAPKIVIEGAITNPEKPEIALSTKTGDPTKYIVTVKMHAKYTFTDLSIKPAYPELDKIELRLFKYITGQNGLNYYSNNSSAIVISGNDNLISKTMTSSYKDESETDSEGIKICNYKYTFEIDASKLEDTKIEAFFIKATGYSKSGISGSVGQYNIKLDAAPPSITEIKMINNTVATQLGEMQISDETTKLFTNAMELNTLYYTVFKDNTFKTATDTAVTKEFKDRLDKKTKDGRYVKDGDEISITVTLLEQSFDETTLNTGTDKNILKASFDNLGTGDKYIVPTIKPAFKNIPAGEENGQKIEATWTIKVANGTKDSIIANMNILAIDKYGNSNQDINKKENRVGNIQIAKIDNNTPEIATFLKDVEPVKITSVLTKFEDGKITKDGYRITATASKTDSEGLRAFKVYYVYDSRNSDFEEKGRESKTGKHDNDIKANKEKNGALHYFYIKAGDAINLTDSDGVIYENLNGFGDKIPDSANGDDGKYIFKISAVDKAGNETPYGTNKGFTVGAVKDIGFGISKTIYVDTQAPVIENAVLRKDPKDNDNTICTDNFVKKNDKAYIYADVADYSAVTSSAVSYENYYIGTGYPSYESITKSKENPKVTVTGENSKTDTEKTKLNLRIGDNGNYLVVSVNAVQGEHTLTVGAKDLAGNEKILEFKPTVDNTINIPVLKAWSLEGKNKSYTDVSDSIKTIDSADPAATNVHFTKYSSYILNISNIDNDVISGEITHNNNYITKGVLKDMDYNVSGTGYVMLNCVNNAKLIITDKAGNKATSNLAEIVVDNLVGNGNGVVTKEATAERAEGNVYKVKMNFVGLGNEYAGIQNYKITGSYSGKYTECVVDKTGDTPLKAGQAWSISPTINLTVPSDKVGTIIYLPGVLMDNLGNERIFNYKVLLPGKDIKLKSQQKNSEKEIRTKVRVIDEKGKLNLQQTEETGKSAVKPQKK